MPIRDQIRNGKLGLKAGQTVEVRSANEVLATLDERGRLENLPFMQEMFQYCGRRFRVFKRADKTCDYIQGWSIRFMKDAVHLEGVRCDGSAHDGCQAGCLIFWKEAWLKRVEDGVVPTESLQRSIPRSLSSQHADRSGTFFSAVQTTSPAETIYTCQATDVPVFTEYMSGWDLRQYYRDIRSGNLASGLAGNTATHRLLDVILALIQVLRSLVITVFNKVESRRHGPLYPLIEGTATRVSDEELHLQPGELVQVRDREEIMATLDKNQRHRGLWFDSEMLPYCGGIYRVLRRVDHIIDEKTRKMITMKFPCIVLEGVVCRSDFHRLCPRAIYPYWRESWLKRVPPRDPPSAPVEEEPRER